MTNIFFVVTCCDVYLWNDKACSQIEKSNKMNITVNNRKKIELFSFDHEEIYNDKKKNAMILLFSLTMYQKNEMISSWNETFVFFFT